MEAFAHANKKTLGQVRETYSFLVTGRIFEFSDEGREEDGKGRGRVARRFEREMRGGKGMFDFFFILFLFLWRFSKHKHKHKRGSRHRSQESDRKKNSSWLESATGKPAPRASLGIPMPMPDGIKKRGDV